MMSKGNIVLPPPDALRDYAVGLWSWAQGRPCETFLEALVRRLGFGPAEKKELAAGLREVLASRPGADLLAQSERFSPSAQASLALMLVVRGLHQLMTLNKKTGKVPPEIEESIRGLRRLEELLDTTGPNTAGRKHLRLYRQTLVGQKLLKEKLGSQARLRQPPPQPPPRQRHSAPSASPADDDGPSVAKLMLEAAKEAQGEATARPSGRSYFRGNSSALLYVALAVTLIIAGIWMSRMNQGLDLSGPSDIHEVPVLSMTRHATSVHLRVPAAWISRPLVERTKSSEALFDRLQQETEGAVVTLTLMDPDRVLLGTVTSSGVIWEES